MTQTAVLFPGQGSLTPDAGERTRAAWPELVERAAELTGDDPFERAAESTRFQQPAIFVASMAAWRERVGDIDGVCAMAGHSLGELSALVAAGAIDVDAGLRLVVLRGRLMEEAALAAQVDGGMVALLGGAPADAEAVAAEHGLVVANDNAPGQVVLSGPRAGVEAVARSARAAGFKALVLDVPGAFHSHAVAAAAAPFREALEAVVPAAPDIPVVSGCTAAPFTDIPLELSRALISPVRWREVMGALYELGARAFVDIGPGKVLARLVLRNLPVLEEHALAG